MTKSHTKLKAILLSLFVLGLSLLRAAPTHAIGQFALSPMYQQITLTPGETYVGNFEVINPGDNSTSDNNNNCAKNSQMSFF